MPELSEMIRDHVNAVAQHVTLEDVWARTQAVPPPLDRQGRNGGVIDVPEWPWPP